MSALPGFRERGRGRPAESRESRPRAGVSSREAVRRRGDAPPVTLSWRATQLSLVFIGFALVTILAVPAIVRRRVEAIRGDVIQQSETAREATEGVARDLAIEVSADRAYDLTGDTSFYDRFREARKDQQRAFSRLRALAPELGPAVEARTTELSDALHDWEALPLLALAGEVTRQQHLADLPRQEIRFERTIAAARALDEAIHAAAARRRAIADRLETLDAVLTAVFTVFALVGLLLVARLAYQLRRAAHEEATMRAQLQSLFDIRERLIRGFSHDVKNPLGAADGYAQLLEAGIIADPAGQMSSIGRIRASIASALRLINDLLDLARADAGELQLVRMPLDVGQLAGDVAEEYRAQAEAAGLHLEAELPSLLPSIVSDPARIRQVLGNLLSNAIKYTDEGGRVGLRVGVRPGRTAPGVIAFQVWDTGHGIPPELREHIFQEFTRLEPNGRHGAGLGLAISRRLARALGGDVALEDLPGPGATFTFSLPIESPAPADGARR